MGIFIAMIIASVILLLVDPKFGGFVCLLALLSGAIQWQHQRKQKEQEQKEASKKSGQKKKSTRPRKKK